MPIMEGVFLFPIDLWSKCDQIMASGKSNLAQRKKNRCSKEDHHRRTGRYVAGGMALAVTLLGLHHVLLRGASTIAGVCVPAIIMASYIIWVLYSARRDRRKALRLAMTMQLTEVITVPPKSTSDAICKDAESDGDFGRNPSNSCKSQDNRENPAFPARVQNES